MSGLRARENLVKTLLLKIVRQFQHLEQLANGRLAVGAQPLVRDAPVNVLGVFEIALNGFVPSGARVLEITCEPLPPIQADDVVKRITGQTNHSAFRKISLDFRQAAKVRGGFLDPDSTLVVFS